MTNEENPAGAGSGPCPCKAEMLNRRGFFERLIFVFGGIGAAILTVPAIGFILGPIFKRPTAAWRSVGKTEAFKVGETVAVYFRDPSPLPWAGVTANSAAWLRRDGENEFTAFAINCTHLGCPVRWLSDANLFMCPCHGGVYYNDGAVAAGPPPRPLSRYAVRVEAGEVQLQTNPIRIVGA
jgi:menaquinol-cytochrome c reductase iron-sulfur subunit